jgi:hypothetical protein
MSIQFTAFLVTDIIAIDCKMVAKWWQVKGSGGKCTNALAPFTTVNEEGKVVMKIFVEQQVLCQCNSFCKSLLNWFSAHYVFNLYCREAALFLQELVLQLPERGKKSSNYLAVATELSKIATAD